MTLFGKFEYLQNSVFQFHRSLANRLTPYLAPSNLLTVAILAFGYFVVGKFCELWASPNHSVTAIWLPAGISVAALLLLGYRAWPGIFVGTLLLSITITGSTLVSAGLALGSSIEALAAAYLVSKYASGINAFFKARDVLHFVFFAAIFAPALGASIGVSLLWLDGLASLGDFSMLWLVWWTGDMLGVLFLTPFLVLLLGHRHHSLGLAEPFEIAALVTGLITVCVLNFGPRLSQWIPGNGELFLCTPFLIWAALRFCPLEAAGATLVMGGFAMWAPLQRIGPVENAYGLPLFVGAFMAIGIAATMTVAAANAEQKRATKDVLGMYCVLQDRKEHEIRMLQATVESLQAELARHGH